MYNALWTHNLRYFVFIELTLLYKHRKEIGDKHPDNGDYLLFRFVNVDGKSTRFYYLTMIGLYFGTNNFMTHHPTR